MYTLKKQKFATLVFAGLSFLFAKFAFAEEGPGNASYHFATMHQHPWFWDVMGASVVGWIVGRVKGFSSSKDWLQRYWPNAPVVPVFLLDLAIFVIVGAYFGTGIYNPNNFLEALAAGLAWPVGLGSLATKD